MDCKTICPYHPSVAKDGFISEEWGETKLCYFIKDRSGTAEELENNWCKTSNYQGCKIFGRKKATENGVRESYIIDLRNRESCSDIRGTLVCGSSSDGL